MFLTTLSVATTAKWGGLVSTCSSFYSLFMDCMHYSFSLPHSAVAKNVGHISHVPWYIHGKVCVCVCALVEDEVINKMGIGLSKHCIIVPLEVKNSTGYLKHSVLSPSTTERQQNL